MSYKNRSFERTISVLEILIRFYEIVNEIQPHGVGLLIIIEGKASMVPGIIELFGYIFCIL